ncbi:MAG: HD domain-containing protein [Candidatus Paceibacterota bacterium]
MRTVQEIYDAYRIMPGLQLHQLRVAAVAKTICDSFDQTLDSGSVVLACLFHDMGNILKADLTLFPKLLAPQGIDYWQGIQKEYAAKYGPSEHAATSEIVREIGISGKSISLIEGIGFSKMFRILEDDSHYELKIVEYGDCRVAPYGVVSIAERFDEGGKRYTHRHPSSDAAREHYLALAASGYGIERQIFAHASIRPEDITEGSVQSLIPALREYKVT